MEGGLERQVEHSFFHSFYLSPLLSPSLPPLSLSISLSPSPSPPSPSLLDLLDQIARGNHTSGPVSDKDAVRMLGEAKHLVQEMRRQNCSGQRTVAHTELRQAQNRKNQNRTLFEPLKTITTLCRKHVVADLTVAGCHGSLCWCHEAGLPELPVTLHFLCCCRFSPPPPSPPPPPLSVCTVCSDQPD